MVSVTLVVADDQIPANALEDVVVRVFSEDGLTFVTQGLTDADGELVLELDEATYWARFFKLGYQFESRLTVEVDAGASSNTFDVEAVDLTILPPSTVPSLCKASGYVRGPDLAPKAGIRLVFSLTGKPRIVAGQVMVVQDLITVSDEDGWVEVELVRGGVYDCVVDGMDDSVFRVVVPDRTSVALTELVWPYIASLTYSIDDVTVDEVEVAAGESTTVTATTQLSSGVTTPYELDDGTTRSTASWIHLDIADPTVASFTLSDDVLTITGIAAGTTEITAEVVPDIETERIPVPTRSLATLTVTVT